ncbi:hypothetical protein B5G20_02765 [Collinsella sp. An7]|uniref:hypothetical protein n=1 Tax=Collinsella sp. An7 TaxID=1965651 RepID=UPI000B374802|nr:hypothetical protein [Collinsella sp. An7]OUN47658.1 hypothetical protein B5G20_02765 [Collinsella sp. An7]
MEKTYSIGGLAAQAYLRDAGHPQASAAGYECPEGRADIVCVDADSTTLVFVTAKRARKGSELEPSYSQKRLSRIAMCYLVEHPGVESLSCDVLCALIGSGGTVTVSCVKGAYVWKHEE